MHVLLVSNDQGDELAFGPFDSEALAVAAREELDEILRLFGNAIYRVMPLRDTLSPTSLTATPKAPTYYPVVPAYPITCQGRPGWCMQCRRSHGWGQTLVNANA